MKEQYKEDLKEALDKGNIDVERLSSMIKMSPSKKKVLSLSKDALLQYNALIFHKGCQSLSSAERKMVQERIAYGITKGSIAPEEVAYEINSLNSLIKGELINRIDDNSSTKE